MSWPRGFSRWPTIRQLSTRYELQLSYLDLFEAYQVDPPGGAKGEEHWFSDLRDAEEFFYGLMQDLFAAQVLRDFALDELHPFRVWNTNRFDDFELARGLARLAVEQKVFRVVRFHDPLPLLPFREVAEEAPAPPSLALEPKQSWVGIQVVWDDTGEPVAGVPLVVESAGNVGASRSMRETGADGVARFEVPPGLCEARCSFNDLTAAECAAAGGRRSPAEPQGDCLGGVEEGPERRDAGEHRSRRRAHLAGARLFQLPDQETRGGQRAPGGGSRLHEKDRRREELCLR